MNVDEQSMSQDPEMGEDSFYLPLREELELLGAAFAYDEALDLLLAERFAGEEDERTALATGVGMSDLSGISAQLIAGADAPALVQAACSQMPLEVGECDFGAVLTGDGALVSVPLVARTGDAEYLLWDGSVRAGLLGAWLGFLANIEEQGSAPFANAQLEDVSEHLVPLLIAGPMAEGVLRDYTDALPQAGEVASIALDAIQCLVVGLPAVFGLGWLVFVGSRYSRVLWRSLLSFPAVTPVGWRALGNFARERLAWGAYLDTAEHVKLEATDLLSWGLVRKEGGFVGARALGL